jgi:hypothetical protein
MFYTVPSDTMPQLSTPQPLPSRPFLVNTFPASVHVAADRKLTIWGCS